MLRTAFPLLLTAFIGLVSIVAPRVSVLKLTLLGSLLVPSLVVLEITEGVRGPVFLGLSLALVIALYRGVHVVRSPGFLIVAWLTLQGIALSVNSPSTGHLALNFSAGLFMLVLAFAASTGKNDLEWVLKRFVVVLVLTQVPIATREVFYGGNALWPRRDGETWRVLGENTLLTNADIQVRAMGSLGYVITLGVVMGFCLVVSFWFALRERSWRMGMVAGACGYVVLLSGARTAVLAILVALLALLAFTLHNFWSILAALAMAPLLVSTVATGDALSLLGFGEGFEDSVSFQHRIAVQQSASGLLDRPLGQSLFGGGIDGVPGAFDEGYVSGYLWLKVFDNEYLRSWAAFGVVGAALFICVLLKALLQRSLLVRTSAAFFAVASYSYDTLSWTSIAVLIVLIACSSGYDKESVPQKVRVLSSYRTSADVRGSGRSTYWKGERPREQHREETLEVAQ